MNWQAEDKYADIIHLPLLTFFKKCEKHFRKTQKNVKTGIKKAQKKCVNKLTTHYTTTHKQEDATTRNRNEQIGGHKA